MADDADGTLLPYICCSSGAFYFSFIFFLLILPVILIVFLSDKYRNDHL